MTSTLRSDSGSPISDNQNSQTAGQGGPILLQDQNLIEKLARFNRERIPERIVHAVGSGAYGTFTVTNPDLSRWTRMSMFAQASQQTDTFARFSTVAGSRGAADSVRDPRGFALKFYTEDGNWDLVGNNTPVFFIRDPLKFPDFIHSQKPDPFTNEQEPNNVWDFFSHSPEATHQFVWLFGDRGIPASYRHMNGYGSHTYQWVNASGEQFWVKFHFKTDQGIKCLTSSESDALAGGEPQHHQHDLLRSIESGDFPTWTLHVQVMPVADADTYRFNPFDVTKVWPQADYPLIEAGRLELNRNPNNYFAEVEQAAFTPANMVPGIGTSPDRMLQGRHFAYGDAQRYRLGVNHMHLPVNVPKNAAAAANYARDGAMVTGSNGGRRTNYEPNATGGPKQTDEAPGTGFVVQGQTGHHAHPHHREDDDFVQAGNLFRIMSEAEQGRLVENIAGGLSLVDSSEVVDRSIIHFTRADAILGARLLAAIDDRKNGST